MATWMACYAVLVAANPSPRMIIFRGSVFLQCTPVQPESPSLPDVRVHLMGFSWTLPSQFACNWIPLPPLPLPTRPRKQSTCDLPPSCGNRTEQPIEGHA